MSFNSKTAAVAFGKGILKTMPKGWNLDVWENLGWHVCIFKGPASLYVSFHKGTALWNCLIADTVPVSTTIQRMGYGSGYWTFNDVKSKRKPMDAFNAEKSNCLLRIKQLKLAFSKIEESLADA